MSPSGTDASCPPNGPSPVSATFIPRREFIKSPRPASSFYLVTLAGSSLIRLSNFPSSFVRSFKNALEPVRDYRDDPQLKLWEINLNSKPWASPRSVESELLVLRIFSLLLSHGYSFLSSIDYGRESDDKITLVFSSAATAPVGSAASTPSTVQVPFGLSFPSPTLLRAFNLPLSSTPAILYALRTAWPKGIAQEKRLANGCYEFKLKGYSLLKEDTFPLDSLSHTLNLLGSLDERGFTLLASLCISGSHHRVKDLWIFTGREEVSTPSSSSSRIDGPPRIPPFLSSSPSPAPSGTGESLPLWDQFATQKLAHDRDMSLPAQATYRQNGSVGPSHVKSASEGSAVPASSSSPFITMPRPMPHRPFVAVGAGNGIPLRTDEEKGETRTQIYSASSDSVGRVIYSSPQQTAFTSPAHDRRDTGSPQQGENPAITVADNSTAQMTDVPEQSEELLNSRVFRVTNYGDSVVQTPSEHVPPVPLPLLWQRELEGNGEAPVDTDATPKGLSFPVADVPKETSAGPEMSRTTTSFSTPNVPGGWTGTPAQELEAPLERTSSPVEEHSQEVVTKTADHVEGDHEGRKSQFGITGVVDAPAEAPTGGGAKEDKTDGAINGQETESARTNQKTSTQPEEPSGKTDATNEPPQEGHGKPSGSLLKRIFHRPGRRQSTFKAD